MTENLNKSFAVILGLVVLVIIQHLAHLLALENVWLSVSIDALVLTFTFSYFLQLKKNLYSFLGINNMPVHILLGTYLVIYLATIGFKITQKTIPANSLLYRAILMICFTITILGTIVLVVQYCIIGSRLFKKKEFKTLKNLGAVFLFVIPVFFVIIIVFSFIRSVRMYSHLFIVLELLPYRLTYKLYSGFRKNSTRENLAGDPLTFYTNERS